MLHYCPPAGYVSLHTLNQCVDNANLLLLDLMNKTPDPVPTTLPPLPEPEPTPSPTPEPPFIDPLNTRYQFTNPYNLR